MESRSGGKMMIVLSKFLSFFCFFLFFYFFCFFQIFFLKISTFYFFRIKVSIQFDFFQNFIFFIRLFGIGIQKWEMINERQQYNKNIIKMGSKWGWKGIWSQKVGEKWKNSKKWGSKVEKIAILAKKRVLLVKNRVKKGGRDG